jgi:two-component system sensor histidine kinase/response regulator
MTGASPGKFQARILIVDDNSFGLSARKSVLQELGHEVVTSCSPQEALTLCSGTAFQVIVTDYRMPDMDGVEFIRQLRAQGTKVPIILVSGFTDTLGLNEQNTGADVVLQKSANEVNHLIRAINRLLRKDLVKKPAGSQPGSPRAKRNTP